MSLFVAFDVDGVLFDTHDLVRDAYREVGIEMPAHAWGQPWQAWLPALANDKAPAIHQAKNTVYLRMLTDTPPRPLAPATTAQRLMEQNVSVFFVTSASSAVATALLTTVNFDPQRQLIASGADTTAKARALRSVSSRGVYVDDQLFLAISIARRAGWKDIWYSGQSHDQLLKDIIWMQ